MTTVVLLFCCVLGSWSAKLYLTPSNIVLLTAIALIGVCVFILAIIGILHWQEKVRPPAGGTQRRGSDTRGPLNAPGANKPL